MVGVACPYCKADGFKNINLHYAKSRCGKKRGRCEETVEEEDEEPTTDEEIYEEVTEEEDSDSSDDDAASEEEDEDGEQQRGKAAVASPPAKKPGRQPSEKTRARRANVAAVRAGLKALEDEEADGEQVPRKRVDQRAQLPLAEIAELYKEHFTHVPRAEFYKYKKIPAHLRKDGVDEILMCSTCYNAGHKLGKAFKTTGFLHKYHEHLRTKDHDQLKAQCLTTNRVGRMLPKPVTPTPDRPPVAVSASEVSRGGNSSTTPGSETFQTRSNHYHGDWQDSFDVPLMRYAFPLAVALTGTSMSGGERLLTLLNPYLCDNPLPKHLRE